MVKVFISYRRIDSGWAGRIHESLGRKRDLVILRDTFEIQPGQEFPRRIQQMIEECDVVIVLIGRGWTEQIDRLNSENDWVRREIRFSREMNKPILPVLVDDVSMPRSQDLPEEIQFLAIQNGTRISDQGFDNHVSELAKFIRDEFRHYEEDRTWTTLNGLRGALNLASRHISGISFEQEVVRSLAAELAPDLFLEADEQIVVPSQLQYRETENYDAIRSLLLQGVAYKTVELNDELNVQIGIGLAKSPIVGVIYEELADDGASGRLVIVFYTRDMTDLPDTSSILVKLGEPRPVPANEYRLPYKSVFVGKVGSDKRFQNTYLPYDEIDEIDSKLFVKLFDMGWIGTNVVDRTSIEDLHRHVSGHYGRFTIVHAIAYKAQLLI